jgi:hypothetical protein
MKRMILIVAIASLPVLSACSVRIRPPCNCPTTTVLEPEVSLSGTLRNLELKYSKGKRLFKKPIQEGFYVRYRIDKGKSLTFYAIGDRISDPKASYSGYRKEISGAGVTSEDGLNVTSAFFFDRNYGTVSVTRIFVNRLKDKTMYLSEIKNYGDANLRPLGTVVGKPKEEVKPLPKETGDAKHALSLRTVQRALSSHTVQDEWRIPQFPPVVHANLWPLGMVVGKPSKVERFSPVKGDAKQALSSHTVPDDGRIPPFPPEPQKWDDNCWPCEPVPDCNLTTLVLDPTKATIVCISCQKDVPGQVHTVCLEDLDAALASYKAAGCEYSVTFTGIMDSRSKFESPCKPPPEPILAKYTSGGAPGEPVRAPSEEALGQLLTLRPTEPGAAPTEETLRNLLELPPKAAVVVITMHKINASW